MALAISTNMMNPGAKPPMGRIVPAASMLLAIDDWTVATLAEPERCDFWEIC